MAGPGKPSFLRRKFVVNPRFQYEIILYFAGTLVITLGVLFWSVNRELRAVIGQAHILGFIPPHPVLGALTAHRSTVNLMFVMVSVVAMLFLVMGSLVLSHRIAGPLFRLVKHMRQIALGADIGAVRFRKDDYFHEIADSFNKLIGAQYKPEDDEPSL
jgi:sensor histidine kinase YesM